MFHYGADMTVGSRIRTIRRQRTLTLQDVALAIDWDTGNLSRVERGLQEAPEKRLRQIAKVLGVEVIRFYLDDDAPDTKVKRTTEGPVYVPISNAEASMGLGVAQPHQEYIVGTMQLSEDWLRSQLRVDPKSLGILTAHGDSMAPTFSDGDVLLVDRSVDVIKLDAVFVLDVHGELFIKRVSRRLDGSVVIKSDNPLYEPHVLSNGERTSLRVLGRVAYAWNGRRL